MVPHGTYAPVQAEAHQLEDHLRRVQADEHVLPNLHDLRPGRGKKNRLGKKTNNHARATTSPNSETAAVRPLAHTVRGAIVCFSPLARSLALLPLTPN